MTAERLNKLQDNVETAIAIGGVSGDTLPVGSVIPWSSNNIPSNYLLCDGSAVSRTEYALLFSVIGTTYGNGNGSTTFNLPNLKGRVPVGKDAVQTEFDVLGETGGEKTHILTTSEMPSHNHVMPVNESASAQPYASGDPRWPFMSDTSYTANLTKNTGENQPHNNLQPYIVLNFIIKAKQSAGLVATVVDGLNSTSETDALSARQGKKLKETTPRLIYEKVITENDTNGFTTTDFSFELGKSYKIFVVGSLSGEGDSIYNLKMNMNDVTPTGARNIIFGSERGNIVNTFSSTDYIRIARGLIGYGLQSEILITYFAGTSGSAWVRAMGHYNCTGSGEGISTNIETMLGSYTETINKFTFSVTEGKQITAGTTIKIFELP